MPEIREYADLEALCSSLTSIVGDARTEAVFHIPPDELNVNGIEAEFPNNDQKHEAARNRARTTGQRNASTDGRKARSAARTRSRKNGLGSVLKKQRHALGLTQRDVAARLGVKAAHVAYLETDRRRPSLSLLNKIATVLGLDRERLFALAHPEARAFIRATGAQDSRLRKTEAWEKFSRNRPLLKQHQINKREMDILARVNLLGKISAPRNFIFILNCIRQAVDEE